jgi:ABC-type oligopeptide transport system ATPase subunit
MSTLTLETARPVDTVSITENDLDSYRPGRGEHAAFVGQNGSGKSFLAKALLSGTDYQSVIIIDPKNEIFVPSADYIYAPFDLPKSKARVIVYRMSESGDNETIESFDSVFQWIYRRGNTLIFIDELMALTFGGNRMPRAMLACYTRGRSLGISCWGCTQRPSWIDLKCLTEAKHIYCFRLTLADDRTRMSGMIGDAAKTALKNHTFLYYNQGMEKAQLTEYDDTKRLKK